MRQSVIVVVVSVSFTAAVLFALMTERHDTWWIERGGQYAGGPYASPAACERIKALQYAPTDKCVSK